MNIAVIGAGAVGCYFGSMLARAGHAVTLITRPTLVEALRSPALPVVQVMTDIVQECQSVTQASAVALPGNLLSTVPGFSDSMPEQMSSAVQDIARGKRSEIDHLNGFIVLAGKALGIAMPTNRLLHKLVRLRDQHLLPQNGGAT